MSTAIRRMDSGAPDFIEQLDALLAFDASTDDAIEAAVAGILRDVRARGDEAVLECTRRFDRLNAASMVELELPRSVLDEAYASLGDEQRAALVEAADRVRLYHERQKQASWEYTEADGTTLGQKVTPLDRVGLYVPGGRASYPSSVLMNAVPAKVAGVGRLTMTVPTPDGVVSDLVLAAAHVAGVDEVFRIGGAQAVGALAYGTETIRPVDKITGPGNAYVAAAKRRVFGTVGIDMIAGPSEILVVADGANDPAWIAADLLSQAEHDTAAQSILITDDADFGRRVALAVESHLKVLPRGEIARQSWEAHGAIVVVPHLDDCVALVDRIAPEHLELAVENPDALAAKVRNAGAIFLGRYTPEAVGDYIGGPNHVLPTARSARFSSGLGVHDFMKRTTLLGCDANALRAIGPAAVALAGAEGLGAHGLSVALRLNMAAP